MEGAPVAGREVLIVAGGCFWCIEAVMNNVRGVDTAISGYLNGHSANPTYKEVCGGDSGHVEAVRVTFDPAVVSMEKLLRMWVTVHDPTQLNRQGNDYGTQYRSGVYYLTDAQRDTAQAFLREEQAAWRDPIVSEVVPAGPWYDAEDYHQRYFEKNPDAGYCRAVVKGKVDKAKAKLPQMLK